MLECFSSHEKYAWSPVICIANRRPRIVIDGRECLVQISTARNHFRVGANKLLIATQARFASPWERNDTLSIDFLKPPFTPTIQSTPTMMKITPKSGQTRRRKDPKHVVVTLDTKNYVQYSTPEAQVTKYFWWRETMPASDLYIRGSSGLQQQTFYRLAELSSCFPFRRR